MPRKKQTKFEKFYLKNYEKIKLGLFFASLIVFCLTTINVTNSKEKVFNHKLSIDEGYQIVVNSDIPQIDVEEPIYHVSMEVIDEGYNLYSPPSSKAGYRYGPSIIRNEDGSLDAWFSSPGNNSSEWDWITYKHSDDGVNWTKDKIVLQPTGDTMDHYSVCDPGVIYFNGYYYLGYSSTVVATNEGINNNIYVARSKNPDGPFEKWNGNGWGGKPKPIIYYDESNEYWGAGEISFVINNNTLYCYYSWYCEHGFYTKVSTASLSEDWPNDLEYRGIIYFNVDSQDSSDVVYLDEYDKFVSFAVVNRMSDRSGIIMYESDDGLNFNKADTIYSNISMYAHNLGITKGLDGHISENDDLAIAYAYSNSYNSKGKWATRYQPIKLIVYKNDEYIGQDEGGEPTYRTGYTTNNKDTYTCGISANKKSINIGLNETSIVSVLAYNQNRGNYLIKQGLRYEYDESIINIVGNRIIPVSEGECVVNVHYDDFYTTLLVKINNSTSKEISKFEPVEDTLEFYIEDNNYHTKQIRAYVEFENGSWGEAYNDYTIYHPTRPAMIDGARYHLTYDIEDESICEVDDKGIVTPLKKGETKIKVTINDDNYFYVNIIVKF